VVKVLGLLHDDLRQAWMELGRPSAQELAKATGLDPQSFHFLLKKPDSIPSKKAVAALAGLVNDPHKYNLHLGGERIANIVRLKDDLENAVKQRTIQTGSSSQSKEDEAETRLLRDALTARNLATFVKYLKKLREVRHVSFSDIAAATDGKIAKSTANRIVQSGSRPSSDEQVYHFVRGCGVRESEARVWKQAFHAARSAEQAQVVIREASSRSYDPGYSHRLEDMADEIFNKGDSRLAYAVLKVALRCGRNPQTVIAPMDATFDRAPSPPPTRRRRVEQPLLDYSGETKHYRGFKEGNKDADKSPARPRDNN
jgi:hypothetical protein